MKKVQVKSVVKKVTICILAAVTFTTGVPAQAMNVEAASYGADTTDNYKDEILYEHVDIKSYWNSENAKAPIKEGYVFGGWYADEEGKTPLTKETAGAAEIAYAKFVPAYVLSVKAQLSFSKGNDGKSSIRLISSVDSEQYAKVGFKVLLANQVNVAERAGKLLETTTVYKRIQVQTSESETKEYEADKVFGALAKKFSVWRIDGFADNWSTMIVNVTPYWITLDGTKVEGIAKYVHVEDGKNGYISVPVYVQSEEPLAAGVLQMTYPACLQVHDVQYCNVDGALIPKVELAYKDDGEGTIVFVANAATVGEGFASDGIYANVRFTVKDDNAYQEIGSGKFLDFETKTLNFSNWEEQVVDVNAWAIQY